MCAGVFEFGLVFQLIDFADNRTLADLELGFREVGLRLLECRMPLLGVAAMLRLFLLYLMLEVLVLGLGVPRGFQLLRAIEISTASDAPQSRVDANAGEIALSPPLLAMTPNYRAGQTGW